MAGNDQAVDPLLRRIDMHALPQWNATWTLTPVVQDPPAAPNAPNAVAAPAPNAPNDAAAAPDPQANQPAAPDAANAVPAPLAAPQNQPGAPDAANVPPAPPAAPHNQQNANNDPPPIGGNNRTVTATVEVGRRFDDVPSLVQSAQTQYLGVAPSLEIPDTATEDERRVAIWTFMEKLTGLMLALRSAVGCLCFFSKKK